MMTLCDEFFQTLCQLSGIIHRVLDDDKCKEELKERGVSVEDILELKIAISNIADSLFKIVQSTHKDLP